EPTSIKQLIPSSNKITFSLTLIDSKNILDELRAFWKEQNVKALQKFAQMRDIPPSKAKNLDFDLIVFRNVLYKVTSISNPKEYRERDEKRPSFDPKKVISIRLAKILINLSEAKNEITDPFCGTGTILQEALLMGYRVIGIDLFIDDARKNIEWLGKNYRNKTKFLQGDVTKVLSQMQSVEAIVTEPYMGPYYKKLPSEQEAQRTIKELIPLYTNFFTALHPKIKGKVVILLPRIRTYMKTFTLPINEILQKTGFEIVSPLPSIKLPLEYEKRHSKIERSIYILEAKRKA
ncbi:MAG: DNA methyltransferase, partial [Nanoarchaeota archaeon]